MISSHHKCVTFSHFAGGRLPILTRVLPTPSCPRPSWQTADKWHCVSPEIRLVRGSSQGNPKWNLHYNARPNAHARQLTMNVHWQWMSTHNASQAYWQWEPKRHGLQKQWKSAHNGPQVMMEPNSEWSITCGVNSPCWSTHNATQLTMEGNSQWNPPSRDRLLLYFPLQIIVVIIPLQYWQ